MLVHFRFIEEYIFCFYTYYNIKCIQISQQVTTQAASLHLTRLRYMLGSTECVRMTIKVKAMYTREQIPPTDTRVTTAIPPPAAAAEGIIAEAANSRISDKS